MAKLKLLKKSLIILLVCTITGLQLNCTKDDSNDQDMLMFLLIWYIINAPRTNSTFVSRSNQAMDAWKIALQTGNTSNSRSTDTNFEMNPQNWMTVAGPTCNVTGVPTAWQGTSCDLSGGVIGVCITRYYTGGSTGKLVDTTLVMLDTYQNGSASEADKQSVFTHEVGHCLGLKHAEGGGAPVCGGSYNNCIMFPSTAGADTPHSDELSAIDAAYNPIAVPPTARYNTTGGVAIRHHSTPVFTISGTIGNGFFDESGYTEPVNGKKIDSPIETRVHYYYEDGFEKTDIIKGLPKSKKN